MLGIKIYKKIFYLLPIITISFVGCKSIKKIAIPTKESVYNVENEVNARIRELNNTNQHILISNESFRLSGKSNNNGRFTFYLENGNQIFLSLRFFGFEMIRSQIKEDTVKYINRLKKEYLNENTDKFISNFFIFLYLIL